MELVGRAEASVLGGGGREEGRCAAVRGGPPSISWQNCMLRGFQSRCYPMGTWGPFSDGSTLTEIRLSEDLWRWGGRGRSGNGAAGA